jgi:hypothetical protein
VMIYTYQHINILMIVLSDRTLVITTIIIPLSSGPAGHLATNAMIVVGVLMPPLVAGGIMLESEEERRRVE